MLPLYVAATFLGAALLFAIEPFAARQALPLFGGSPAVWNTSVMFFQAVLVLGYLYAHVLTTRLRWRWQWAVHAALLVAAAFAPLTFPDAVPPESAPVGALVWLLFRSIGLPFFALASAGPLLQRWFAATRHRAGDDPYFLYAASNAGSFLGLLAYPFLIEPLLPLGEQAAWWRGGFLLFAVLVLAAGARVRPDAPRRTPPPDRTSAERPRLERFWWLFLAFVPSSLMLGSTQYISTDLAAAPLLWVIPLGLYLLTFVAAFSRFGDRLTHLAARAWPVVLIAIAVVFLIDARGPILAIVGLHLLVLVIAGVLCHGRLRAMRPDVGRLTEFYLLVSIGGAMGGIFNGLVAPVVFNDLLEYPIAIALACFALPAAETGRTRRGLLFAAAPIALLVWVAVVPRLLPSGGVRQPLLLLSAGVPAFGLFLTSVRPGLFAVCAGVVLLAASMHPDGGTIELRDRTFFGVHTVGLDATGRFRVLSHGNTVHGVESIDPEGRGVPLAYYHRAGPAGQVFGLLGDAADSVGVIGLGAGSLAAYGREGQRMDFFELDPHVVRIARDERYFSFLAASPAQTRCVVGDGRLMLGAEPDASYDILVLDAFSSDAVPVHLLTVEALTLFASKLEADGVMLFHLSNRNLRLTPLVAAACDRVGLSALVRRDLRTADAQRDEGRYASEWLVASPDESILARIGRDVRWERPVPAARPWTDNHADLVSALDPG